jgi:hypothetical protein
MRTSHLICTAFVVMLLTTTTGFANISAGVVVDDPGTSDYDQATDGYSIMVTVPGIYNWSYSLTAYARVVLRGTNPSGTSGQSLGTASVSGIASDSVYATAYLADTTGRDEDTDSASDSGTQPMIVGDDLTFSELCAAYAACGGPMQASSYASTTASGSIN